MTEREKDCVWGRAIDRTGRETGLENEGRFRMICQTKRDKEWNGSYVNQRTGADLSPEFLWTGTDFSQNLNLFLHFKGTHAHQVSQWLWVAEAVSFLLQWRHRCLHHLHHWCRLLLHEWTCGMYRQTCDHSTYWQVGPASWRERQNKNLLCPINACNVVYHDMSFVAKSQMAKKNAFQSCSWYVPITWNSSFYSWSI